MKLTLYVPIGEVTSQTGTWFEGHGYHLSSPERISESELTMLSTTSSPNPVYLPRRLDEALSIREQIEAAGRYMSAIALFFEDKSNIDVKLAREGKGYRIVPDLNVRPVFDASGAGRTADTDAHRFIAETRP